MSTVTLGKISSTPDANGNHKLRCPHCRASFLLPITKDRAGKLQDIACRSCGRSGEPKLFLYAANEDIALKMASDYAQREIKKVFKNAFRGSKNIKFK